MCLRAELHLIAELVKLVETRGDASLNRYRRHIVSLSCVLT